MSIERALIVTCDMCGKETTIKNNVAFRPEVPEGWLVEGINAFKEMGEHGDATCPECTMIVEAVQARYENAVAEAKREYEEALKRCKKTKPQATAEGENHERDF